MTVSRGPVRGLVLAISLLPLGARAADPGAVAAPDLKPDDSWVFDRQIERGTSGFSDERLDFKVEHVGADSMVVGIKKDGSPTDFEDHVMGANWSQRRLVNGEQITIGRPFQFPLTVGRTWTLDYTDPSRQGLQTSADHHEVYKVTGWEDVTTPAGAFRAIKIESEDKIKAQVMAASAAVGGAVATNDGSTVVAHTGRSDAHVEYSESFATFYYAPSVKYWVKTVEDIFNSENVRTARKTDLLVSFKPAA